MSRLWRHSYIEMNLHCKLLVAAKELVEIDAKFIALYRMFNEIL